MLFQCVISSNIVTCYYLGYEHLMLKGLFDFIALRP